MLYCNIYYIWYYIIYYIIDSSILYIISYVILYYFYCIIYDNVLDYVMKPGCRVPDEVLFISRSSESQSLKPHPDPRCLGDSGHCIPPVPGSLPSRPCKKLLSPNNEATASEGTYGSFISPLVRDSLFATSEPSTARPNFEKVSGL